RSATPTSTTCDSAHGAGGGLSGEYGNRDAGGRGWTWQIGCASTYGASRTTPCTIWSLRVTCTSKPKCLLWPRFCVASRNTRGTSWGWSWWRSGMTMTDLTPERLAELRRIASAATPGPWQWAGSRDKGDPHAYVYAGDYASEGEPDLWCEIVSECPEADAQHIATFDPTTALALLDRIEALEQERDAARGEVEKLCSVIRD